MQLRQLVPKSGDGVGGLVGNEGRGSVFDEEALKVLIDFLALGLIEFTAAIFQEFIQFGAIIFG